MKGVTEAEGEGNSCAVANLRGDGRRRRFHVLLTEVAREQPPGIDRGRGGVETGSGDWKRGDAVSSYSNPPGAPPGAPSGPPPGPPPGAGGVGRRIEEAIELIEMEFRHAVAYVNDAVVPQVRQESIVALRKLGDALKNLADKMDDKINQGRGSRG